MSSVYETMWNELKTYAQQNLDSCESGAVMSLHEASWGERYMLDILDKMKSIESDHATQITDECLMNEIFE